jgi:hypothetical protein
MYVKLTMYLFFYMVLELNNFWCGQIYYSNYLKGWALKIFTVLGPNGTRFACCLSGPKKSRFSGSPPSNGPRNGFARIKIIIYHAI